MLYELEEVLVDDFKKHFFKRYNNKILITEMPIRWGNIDVLSITNNNIPFNRKQCEILAKKSNAMIFMKLNNNKPLTKDNIISNIGLSKSTFNVALNELIKNNLIVKKGNCYSRNINFSFPKVIISGYEAKLKDFKKAFFQANINKSYVDHSYLIFPLDTAIKIANKNEQLLNNSGIGLIGVDNKKTVVIVKARKQDKMKSYLRLMNIVTAHLINSKNKKALLYN